MKEQHEQLGDLLLGRRIDQGLNAPNRAILSVQNFIRSMGLIIALSATPTASCTDDDSFDNNTLQNLSESDVENDRKPEYVPIKFTLGSEGLTISGFTVEPIAVVVHFFDSNKKLIGDEVGQGLLCQDKCKGVLPIPEGSDYALASFYSDGDSSEKIFIGIGNISRNSPDKAPGI